MISLTLTLSFGGRVGDEGKMESNDYTSTCC